ncbi:MAG: elongation factor G [Betaproteobacteria bacterium]|nr:elongation factor G [Betaproteobacteria bacterium]
MARATIAGIRTLALVGQAGAGKTSLAEALLAEAGTISAAGSVERGSTVCDHDPLERSYHHSLRLAVASFEFERYGSASRVHLLDAPGYTDFLGHALPALDAVETAAIVINAQNGIELGTTRMMQRAQRNGLCRIIIVNRIDGENVDLPKLLEDLQQEFGKECLPFNLPAGGGTRVSDCFFAPSGESDFSSVAAVHSALIDQVVEIDEQLMASYLEKGEVSPEELHEPFERALREGHIIPVLFTSARTGAGVKELLEVIVRLLPNPLEGNPPIYTRTEGGETREITANPVPGAHVLAHVFKIEIDPYVGKLAVFRIHQGRITPNLPLYVGDARKPFKVGHLYMIRGKEHFEVPEGIPGDILAVAKIDDIHFDAILHDAAEDAAIHARASEFPASVFGVALVAKKRGDEQKIADALHKLVEQDPCLRVEHTAQETVLRGLGELHVRVALARMQEQNKLELDTRPPSVPFRETISAKAEGHARHKKQTGGAGQFGEVYLRVEPLARGEGFEFVDKVKGGVIPNQFIPAIEKGVRQVLETGYIAGYPIQDLRVVVYDGKHHPVDSKEVAFVSAGRKALLDAMTKARPIVLEPIMEVEATVPEGQIGDVTGDLTSRRAQLKGAESMRGGTARIAAVVPLSEMENFPSRLKSLTAGAGSFTLEFNRYEPAPALLQNKLVSQYKRKEEDD